MEIDVGAYLDNLALERPDIAIPRIDAGMQFRKDIGFFYEIDDPDIVRRLGDFPRGAVPYKLIHETVKSRNTSNVGIHYAQLKEDFERFGRREGEKIVMPFSKVLECRGECLEKAILVQLAAQKGRKSFFINGLLEVYDDVGIIGPHAYNIVFNDGPHLVDAQNPMTYNGKLVPYIVPVTSIEHDELVIPENLRCGRVYMLF